MELGTAIFLSSIFLGTVALFVATKDRWNWKRILLWPVAILAALGALGSAGVYAYTYIENQPRPLDELGGIKIGWAGSDVRFAKGEPSQKIDDATWRYGSIEPDSNRGSYMVRFKDGKVRFVAYTGPSLWAPSIVGFSGYASRDELVTRLGNPSHISRSDDELRRWLSFDKYNLSFLLEKNEVTAFAVFDPKHGPLRFSKEAP